VADIVIERATVADAGELLTLQRAAYVTEAQLYGNAFLLPLNQTLDELRVELEGDAIALKAMLGARIVGAGRAQIRERVMHIARLTVAPDQRRRGIGTAVLRALEVVGHGSVDRYALFTGDRSANNLSLYQRNGYVETRRELLQPGVMIVHLEKPAEAVSL
jgi:GNAT superfamily N-acetyltransferase